MRFKTMKHFISAILILCLFALQLPVNAAEFDFSSDIIREDSWEQAEEFDSAELIADSESWDDPAETSLGDDLVELFDDSVPSTADTSLEAEAVSEDDHFSSEADIAFEAAEESDSDPFHALTDSVSNGDELVSGSYLHAIVLLLDCNDYMSGTPIRQMQDAAIAFCQEALDRYQIGQLAIALVAVGSTKNVRTVLDFSSNINYLKDTIYQLTAKDGGSDIGAGLAVAHNLLKRIDASQKSMILMTQGIPDEGENESSGAFKTNGTDNYAKANFTYQYANYLVRQFGYRIYSVGIGARVDPNSYSFIKAFLNLISNYGYYFVEENEDMTPILSTSIPNDMFSLFNFDYQIRCINSTNTTDQYHISVTIENNKKVDIVNPSGKVYPDDNGKIISGYQTQIGPTLKQGDTTTFKWTYEIKKTAYDEGGTHTILIDLTCDGENLYHTIRYPLTYPPLAENKITVPKKDIQINSNGKKKTVKLNAKAPTKLTYKSSVKAVKVSKGKVTIPKGFLGNVTITINASRAKGYKAASEKVVIRVLPTAPSNLTIQGYPLSNNTINYTAVWKASSFADGYELQIAADTNYDQTLIKTITINKQKTKSYSANLQISLTAKSRMRAYKSYKGKKYYSEWILPISRKK